MLQQLTGINAVLFYSSTIFAAAGKEEIRLVLRGRCRRRLFKQCGRDHLFFNLAALNPKPESH